MFDVQFNEVLFKEMEKSVQELIIEEVGMIIVSVVELGVRFFDDYFDKMCMMGDVVVQDVLEVYLKYDESDFQFKVFFFKCFEMVKNFDFNVVYVYFGSIIGGMYMWFDEFFLEGYDFCVRLWYKEVVDKNGLVWIEFYKDVLMGKWIVIFFEFVYINGEFVGVIGVDVFVLILIDQVKQIKIGQIGYIVILNKDGIIIVYFDESFVQKFNIYDDLNLVSFVGELDKNKEIGWIRYIFKGVDKIGGYKRMKMIGWIVLVMVFINELIDLMMNVIDFFFKSEY